VGRRNGLDVAHETVGRVPGASKRRGVRLGFRTLLSLALCAAAAGAVLAHVAIDVVGDYALSTDSYDHLHHSSRELISGVALAIAAILVGRGLRGCCEIAQRNRTRLAHVAYGVREVVGYSIGVVGASCVLVPAMEWLDGRLDGIAVREIGDAFGGSLLLGLGTTAICASLVAALIFALARWLISYRDAIVAILETLTRWSGDAVRRLSCELERYCLTFRRRASLTSRLSKRGPPVTLSV
jgi:hypothetical protein